jgi:putative hemolysin
VAGVFGGATVAARLNEQLKEVPALAPYSQALSLGLVVLCITYLSLVIGELAPKRLALHSPERIATLVAGPLRVLSSITRPVVWVLGVSTDLVLRLIGIRPSTEPPVTEEEIRVMLRQGTEAGVFEAAEHEMVEGVFRLGDRRINALMTPRREIVWLDGDAPTDQVRQTILESGHSRFPVCQGSLDHVKGIVHSGDLLVRCLDGQPLELLASLRPPLFIPENQSANRVLELFKATGQHHALVIDEYGVVQGLVTITDLLEEVVGDIDQEEPQAVQREDGSWLLDGLLPVDEFKELLGLRQLPEEERGHYQTLAGLIITHLGHIPAAGEHFVWNGLRFEIVDMDGNRVDKVVVSPVGDGERSADGII